MYIYIYNCILFTSNSSDLTLTEDSNHDWDSGSHPNFAHCFRVEKYDHLSRYIHIYIYICIYIYLHMYIYIYNCILFTSNSSDLTLTEDWNHDWDSGSHPNFAHCFRVVKYDHLSIYIYIIVYYLHLILVTSLWPKTGIMIGIRGVIPILRIVSG